MELVHVKIINYRSIENIELNFEKETKVFIGISETGKSNLLKALNVINPNYSFDSKDIRENINLSDTCELIYSISLDNNEIKDIKNEIQEVYKYINLDNIFMVKGRYIGFENMFNDNFKYTINVENKDKIVDSVLNFDGVEIDSKIKKLFLVPGEKTKLNRVIDGTEINVDNSIYFDEKEYSYDETKMQEISKNEFIEDIIAKVNEMVLSKININVLYWKYSDENLLPSEIKTLDFVKNPNLCLPLKKIFELAGKENIELEYNKCLYRNRKSAWKNTLNEINKKINKYIKDKWSSIPDNTKIILSENGDYISIDIKDTKNNYEMFDRSDGYKRLMTFLIMISIDNKLSKLKNSLILIDSPDLEIDVPSQKYLKNELIEIGKNNFVFYSTHSPYMIDNDNIGRQFIVSKKSEVTNIEQAEESKAYDNAQILNSLGTSLFENICDINIAFEGFTDKKLYDYGKKLLSSQYHNKLKNVGRCQFGGLRNLNAFIGIWELVCKSKKCIVCIDNDLTAKEKMKSYDNNGLNDVCDLINYGKYVSSRIVETAEDFLTYGHIKTICDDFSKKYNKTNCIDENKLKDDNKPKMDTINAWLGKFKFDKSNGEFNRKKSELKNKLFENINDSCIRNDYKIFLEQFIDEYIK